MTKTYDDVIVRLYHNNEAKRKVAGGSFVVVSLLVLQ